MRRIFAFLSSLVAVTVTLVSTCSAAFAVRVTPPSGGSPVDVAPVAHHSAGLDLWQVALIAAAGVIVLAIAALGTRLMVVSRRPASRPATS